MNRNGNCNHAETTYVFNLHWRGKVFHCFHVKVKLSVGCVQNCDASERKATATTTITTQSYLTLCEVKSGQFYLYSQASLQVAFSFLNDVSLDTASKIW